ncbi:unnamed protein product [Arctogadus glacialis]
MERHEVTRSPQVSSEKPRLLDIPTYTDIPISAESIVVNSTAPRKLVDKGGYHLYAGPGRKPRLLEELQEFVKRELHPIHPEDPRSQELKLQVYRNAFGRFIEEFRNYQPLLGAIQKEYENALADLQNQIRELKPLQTRVLLVTEECNRKVLARWEDGQAQVRALEEDKRQLLKDMEDMREQEERQNAVVSRLQCDLAGQYRQYREEKDSRSLLLLKYSLCRCAAEPDEEAYDIPAYDEDKDPVKLKIALKVCRKDLSNTEGELNKIKSEYWGVVPRQDWDALEDAHKRTLLQLQELQRDFDQLKSEHDTLREVHKGEAVQPGVNPEDDLKNNDKEGDDGEEGDVLEPVRTPSSGDRQVYINQLRELLDGKGPVSVADVRAALTSLDPALESAALDHALGLVFQVDAADLDQDALQLDTETLLQRLDVSPRTTSPAPQQD